MILPNREQSMFGLFGILIGVFFASIAFAMFSFFQQSSDEPSFDISRLVVRTFSDPESEQLLMVFGCLSSYAGRSGGQNAPLAAQHYINARQAAGIFIDSSNPDYRAPALRESIESIPERAVVLEDIRSHLRDEYGCDFARALPQSWQ